MRFFFEMTESTPILHRLAGLGLRQKLFWVVLLPVILCVLTVGWVSNYFSSKFLNLSIQRTSHVLGLAQANEIEKLLDQARKNLIALSKETVSIEDLEKWILLQHRLGNTGYREIAYIGIDAHQRHFLLKIDRSDRMIRIPSSQLSDIKPNPIPLFDTIRSYASDQVYLGDIVETYYPLSLNVDTHPLSHVLFRMAVAHITNGVMDGILLLGIDASWIRNILSLYHSPQSPLYAFPRTPEIRYSYLFDRLGWMLFESDNTENDKGPLSTIRIRDEMKGTIGKPGYASCFRPSAEYTTFWNMVTSVQQGLHGVIPVDDLGNQSHSARSNGFLVYAPIRFHTKPNEPPEVVLGLAFLDRTRITLAAQLKQIDVLFIVTAVATLFVGIYIFWTSRLLTSPIQRLVSAVSELQPDHFQEGLHLERLDQESRLLQETINRLLEAIARQMELIQHQHQVIQMAEQRERLAPDALLSETPQEADPIPELCGNSPAILALKADILKAAKSEADVLITGETGTGKQLAAEAIHMHSDRSPQPFITINCGALDENLLLDALFGHVAGAFSEAKSDRKGAFLSANHGTLFLDEIGNASLKVQQALLRTLSTKTIRPLGSDTEILVDVRLIAATNENLTSLIERGIFREDLYFRLNVISITTPPLRERIDDIPALVYQFIEEASREMGKEGIGISKGAMERLKQYRWPGNVRELKNCITRAVAMVDSNVLQTSDIRLEPLLDMPKEIPSVKTPPLPHPNKSERSARKGSLSIRLNERQHIALPIIQKKGQVTRSEYQQLIGKEIPPRTAQYDLNDLVRKGFLEKIGKGPATRYVPVTGKRLSSR